MFSVMQEVKYVTTDQVDFLVARLLDQISGKRMRAICTGLFLSRKAESHSLIHRTLFLPSCLIALILISRLQCTVHLESMTMNIFNELSNTDRLTTGIIFTKRIFGQHGTCSSVQVGL